MDPRSGDRPHAKPLLLGSREVMKQSETSLLQGVVLEELKLCQARAVPAWQSQFALTGQTCPILLRAARFPQTLLLLHR